MQDLNIALKYSPYILFDKAEPFSVDHIGYTVLRTSGQSPSFRRSISFNVEDAAFCIEYAVYFDYDIQHLYDLEHIWVYVDHQGQICDAEASFHGIYLKSMSLGNSILRENFHLEIYCQPGKHAFLPKGHLFKMLPDWYLACNALAGQEGLLVPNMFKDQFCTNAQRDELVCRYIRSHFSFEPTLKFESRPLSDSLFVPWQKLKKNIPKRIENQLIKIQSS